MKSGKGNTKEFYHCGDKCRYTGKSKILHGCVFFSYEILDGYKKGKIEVTSDCPDCNYRLGIDRSANDPCITCSIDVSLIDASDCLDLIICLDCGKTVNSVNSDGECDLCVIETDRLRA